MENSVITVDTSDAELFKKECKTLLDSGYEMKACDCGFISLRESNFCSSWMAVFVFVKLEEGKQQ